MKDLSARVEQIERVISGLKADIWYLYGNTEPPKAETTPIHRESRENECKHIWVYEISSGRHCCSECGIDDKIKPSPTKESCQHEWRSPMKVG